MEGSYNKVQMDFDCSGMDLGVPTDQQQQTGKYPILINVRQVIRGTLRSRPGLNSFQTAVASNTPWHSVRRLNDKFANDYTYVAGLGPIGTGILASAKAAGATTSRDTGYSGYPLSMLPFRPENTTNEWMAVADFNKMAKIKYDGTVRTLGIAAPLVPPMVVLDDTVSPGRVVVDNGAHYTGAGGIEWGAIASTNNARISTTQATDARPAVGPNVSSAAGWYTVPLNALTNITPSSFLTAGSGATLLVEEVHPGSASGVTCTISRVISDTAQTSNAQSWLTIVPSVALNEFAQHCLVEITHGGTPYTAAVIDITYGPNGEVSFRVYLPTGAASAGDAIKVLPSVFGYSSVGTAAADTWTDSGTKWAAVPVSNTTNLTRGSAGSPLNLNLASFPSGGRKVNEELDEMALSVFISDPSRLSELKIQADCDSGAFDENYWTRSVRPDDLIPVLNNTVTSSDNRAVEIRRQQEDDAKARIAATKERINNQQRSGLGLLQDPSTERPAFGPFKQLGGTSPDDPGAASSKTPAGGNQWFTIRFKMSDWIRVGEDKNVGLFNIIAVRLVVSVNAGGALDIGMDDWAIIGGYEPDVAQGSPYEYSYRYRDSSTGARSNWSPPSRSVVWPHRYQVGVIVDYAAITGVDKLDFRRRGGSVNDWRIIATAEYGALTSYLLDVYSDEHASAVGLSDAALEGNTNAQPFTLQIGAKSLASGVVVAGTMVYDSTARFNTAWAQGTPLICNGIPSLVYRVRSTSLMELYGHCGSASSASLEIPQQYITGQPLPVIFGTLDGWSFALGDANNPGRLYFFNNGTLDSTMSTSWIDVSDSSEQLMNGCVYNGRAYVWSTERMFTISPSGDADIFRADPNTGGVGMYARWALAVGDVMYWLGKDGIYASDGGTSYSVTRKNLLPLFGDEGVAGATVNTITAPNMPQNATQAQLAAFRLCYSHDKYLYFDYKDGTGARRTLVLDRSTGESDRWGWYADVHGNGGAVFHYADEGEGVRSVLVGCENTTTAKLYTLGGSTKTDDGTSFNCQIRTFAANGGDARTEKLVGDGTLDINPGNATITPTFWFDDFSSSVVGTTVTGAGRINPLTIVDFNSGSGQYARNVALDLAWTISSDSHAPVLHGWGFSVMGRPERTIKRATDYSDLGHWGPKDLKGLSVEIDTGGVARDLVVEYTKEDGTVATISKTITASQKTIVHMAWTPVTAYEARIRPTDTDLWRFFEVVKWHYEPLTDLSALVGDWFNFGRATWVQGVEIDGDTNNAAISTDIQRDFSEAIRTISATHNGRGTKAYSFDPPFIAYMVRTAPAGAFRRMHERWIFEPEAPIGTVWETQDFPLGDPYGFSRIMEMEYAAGATVTLKYYVDGTLVHTDSTTLVTTGNTETFAKKQVVLPAVKGRRGKFRAECSTGVRVRVKGTMLLIKSWNGSAFQWVPVAGDTHNDSGARA